MGGTIGLGALVTYPHARSTPAGEEIVRAHGFGLDARLVVKAIKAPEAADVATRAGREKHAVDLARERAALATWRHRGLVAFIGEFRFANGAEPSTCFVLEACEGIKTDGPRNQGADWVKLGASRGEFWRYLKSHDPAALTDGAFRFIAWQLLAPVAYLHANNVMHQDLKNENYLVAGEMPTSAGTVPIMKVSDLGSAKVLTPEEAAGLVRHTTVWIHTGPRPLQALDKWVGTPQYLAPERTGAYIAADDEVGRIRIRAASGDQDDPPLQDLKITAAITAKADGYMGPRHVPLQRADWRRTAARGRIGPIDD